MAELRSIGVIMDDESKEGLRHAYFSDVLEGFKVAVEAYGYSLLFLNNDRTRVGAKSYLEQIKVYGCAGCILACKYDNDEIMEILSSDVPFVAIDKEYDGAICVSSDNKTGMEKLTQFAIEMGHKRLAIITGEDNEVTRIRLQGFLNSCEKADISIPEEYICRGTFRDMNKATYFTEKLLKLKNPPSIIMYSDDYASIGGINTLNARGLSIPKDISITGYDGNEILAQYEPKLTTIKQDGMGIGTLAAEKLLAKIENPAANLEGHYVVDVILEEGRTVAPVYM